MVSAEEFRKYMDERDYRKALDDIKRSQEEEERQEDEYYRELGYV